VGPDTHRKTSVKSYRNSVVSLLRWFGALPHRLTREDVREYLLHLVDARLRPNESTWRLALLCVSFRGRLPDFSERAADPLRRVVGIGRCTETAFTNCGEGAEATPASASNAGMPARVKLLRWNRPTQRNSQSRIFFRFYSCMLRPVGPSAAQARVAIGIRGDPWRRSCIPLRPGE
jgi:hypothetical protein